MFVLIFFLLLFQVLQNHEWSAISNKKLSRTMNCIFCIFTPCKTSCVTLLTFSLLFKVFSLLYQNNFESLKFYAWLFLLLSSWNHFVTSDFCRTKTAMHFLYISFATLTFSNTQFKETCVLRGIKEQFYMYFLTGVITLM